MSGLEFNKIAASLLIAALIAMVIGNITDILYQPSTHLVKRGYQVTIEEETETPSADNAAEIKIDIASLMQAANSDKGKENSTKCAVCHNFEKGAAAKVGPPLWDIVGAIKADKALNYPFSQAMINKGGNWSYEDLYHFLNSPRKFVPGTKMGFAGFKNPKDIANMIAYLRTLSDKPIDLPK